MTNIPLPKYSLGTKIRIEEKVTIITCYDYDDGQWHYYDNNRELDTSKEIEIIEAGDWQPEWKIGKQIQGLNVICGINKCELGWTYRMGIPDSGFPDDDPMWLIKEEIELDYLNPSKK